MVQDDLKTALNAGSCQLHDGVLPKPGNKLEALECAREEDAEKAVEEEPAPQKNEKLHQCERCDQLPPKYYHSQRAEEMAQSQENIRAAQE